MNSVIHHLYLVWCVHHPKSSLLPSGTAVTQSSNGVCRIAVPREGRGDLPRSSCAHHVLLGPLAGPRNITVLVVKCMSLLKGDSVGPTSWLFSHGQRDAVLGVSPSVFRTEPLGLRLLSLLLSRGRGQLVLSLSSAVIGAKDSASDTEAFKLQACIARGKVLGGNGGLESFEILPTESFEHWGQGVGGMWFVKRCIP